jgi:hypothetical protein
MKRAGAHGSACGVDVLHSGKSTRIFTCLTVVF